MALPIQLFLFSLFYTCFIGVFVLPQGLGAALITLMVLRAVSQAYDPSPSQHAPSRVAQGVTLLVALTALALGNTTNQITLAVGYQVVIGAALWLALGRAAGGVLPLTLSESVWAWLHFLQNWARGLRHAHGFPRTKISIDPMYLRGLAGALPVLVVFHLLLGRVNSEYASFMREVLEVVLSPVFWIRAFHTFVIFYLSSTFLAVRLEPKSFNHPNSPLSQAVTVSLLSGASLLLVFDFFQVRLLSSNPLSLPFKEFSLYVQRGFWELISVSVMGYGWWHFTLQRGAALGTKITKKSALRIFALLLLLLAAFALHKVIGLQTLYGLKDTRLFASAATLLLALTFLAGALTPTRHVFVAQLYGLLLCSLLFAAGNVDSFVTRTYPIRVPHAESMTKDYSYLLTNSYDNHRDWGEIMLSMLLEGAHPPQGYYWGDYRPLCITEPSGAKRNLLREHHEALSERVAQSKRTYSGLMRLTFREEGAVAWLTVNKGLVEDALRVAEQSCVPWSSRASY